MAISGYTPLTLKYLCMYNVQKVLPAVYDDSLSYYELLAKIEDKTNEMVGDLNNLNEWQEAQDVVMKELETLVQNFIDGGYLDSFEVFVSNWLDTHLKDIITRSTRMVFFGLTDDGYFTAYVPTEWAFVLDTIVDYNDDNYGSLVIKY